MVLQSHAVFLLAVGAAALGAEQGIRSELLAPEDIDEIAGGNCLLQRERVSLASAASATATVAALSVLEESSNGTIEALVAAPAAASAIVQAPNRTEAAPAARALVQGPNRPATAPAETVSVQVSNETLARAVEAIAKVRKAIVKSSGMTPAQMARLQQDIGTAVLVSALSGMGGAGSEEAEAAAAEAEAEELSRSQEPLQQLQQLQAQDQELRITESGSILDQHLSKSGSGIDAGWHVDVMPRKKSKVILMVIEMFPVLWPLGIERFYLGDIWTGMAKLAVCLCTCFVGGAVWGVVDFATIIVNGLRGQESIDVIGMRATFEPGDARTAQALAIVDLIMVAVWISVARAVHQYRKRLRLERLMQQTMRNADFAKGG